MWSAWKSWIRWGFLFVLCMGLEALYTCRTTEAQVPRRALFNLLLLLVFILCIISGSRTNNHGACMPYVCIKYGRFSERVCSGLRRTRKFIYAWHNGSQKNSLCLISVVGPRLICGPIRCSQQLQHWSNKGILNAPIYMVRNTTIHFTM